MTEQTEETHNNRSWQRIRYGIAALGAVVILGTLMIDLLGAGLEGGIGPAQLFVMVTGGLVVFFALAAPHLPEIYRATSIILLNTVLLLIVIEAGLFALETFNTWWAEKQPPPPPAVSEVDNESAEAADSDGAAPVAVLEDEEWSWNTPAKMAYYQEQPWGTQHWLEISTVGGRTRDYDPFTIWRNIPFEGETVNIDEDGLRVTTNTECEQDDAYTVFVFGGSTIWGIGAPDEYTIPSLLQAAMSDLSDDPVCVVNYGESGYIQTQQLIELMEQLQRDNVPDHVIFYDGANDVFSAYQNNNAHVHHNYYQIGRRLEGIEGDDPDGTGQTRSRFMSWLLNDTHIGRWLVSMLPEPERTAGGIVGNPDAAALPVDVDRLSVEIAQIYETNYRMLSALADQYDFAFDVFWQPVIYTGAKQITEEEAAFTTAYDESLFNLQNETYAYIQDIVPEYDHLHDLANVLDETTDGTYTDYVHLNPIGNQIVADAIMTHIDFETD